MARPRLMLFDEPSLGLAPAIVDDMFDIIEDIRAEGVAVLLVEQNVQKSLEAAQWAMSSNTAGSSRWVCLDLLGRPTSSRPTWVCRAPRVQPGGRHDRTGILQRSSEMSKTYDVGGVQYPRPFRIRRLGHFGFNLNRLDEGLAFYGGLLGFQLTDETSLGKLMSGTAPAMEDDRLFFMTHNTDHHSFLLAHRSLGAMFGDDAGSKDITLSQITWQVGSLEEESGEGRRLLRRRRGRDPRIGRDMPGSNWHVYVRDPDGHTVELYGMEQVGLLGNSNRWPCTTAASWSSRRCLRSRI
jgi:catechol 2,3-dioxygenase-like lactoylglutathione lyase family enzyme